jgi:hypothetical protein
MLVRRFPTVVSLDLARGQGQRIRSVGCVDGPGATSSEQPCLAHVPWTSAGGMRAVSSCTALKKSLNLTWCELVTDEGVRAVVSSCTALTELNLRASNMMDEGVRSVSSLPALTILNLRTCLKVTDVGVRALSCLPALTSLDLRVCGNVTAAGVQALRSTTAAPNLHIEFGE